MSDTTKTWSVRFLGCTELYVVKGSFIELRDNATAILDADKAIVAVFPGGAVVIPTLLAGEGEQ